jgi:hypothetical protein
MSFSAPKRVPGRTASARSAGRSYSARHRPRLPSPQLRAPPTRGQLPANRRRRQPRRRRSLVGECTSGEPGAGSAIGAAARARIRKREARFDRDESGSDRALVPTTGARFGGARGAKQACGRWSIQPWNQAPGRWSETRLSPNPGPARRRAASSVCLRKPGDPERRIGARPRTRLWANAQVASPALAARSAPLLARVCTSAPLGPIGSKAEGSAWSRRHGSARADLGDSSSQVDRPPGGPGPRSCVGTRLATTIGALLGAVQDGHETAPSRRSRW